MRTAESVRLTCWPPAPEARKVSIFSSAANHRYHAYDYDRVDPLLGGDAAFRELLASEASEPVGRRLSFLLQEMNREINTVGSKANDTRISGHVVELKNGLERLREQVENVE
jgi:hypothetical protein